MKVNFYKNKETNEILFSFEKINDENYILLNANTTDAAFEKHVPIYEINNDELIVKVGDVLHPMSEEHYIMLIAYISNNNLEIFKLNPTDEPIAKFKYNGSGEIYAYCNLHGLWKNIIK